MTDKKLLILPYIDIFDSGGGMVTSIRRLVKNLSTLGWNGVIVSELTDESHMKNTKFFNFDVEFVRPVTETWVPLKKPYKIIKFWEKIITRSSLISKNIREYGIGLIYLTGPPSFPLTGHPNNITYWKLLHKLGKTKIVVGVRGASSSWLSNQVLIKIFHWEESSQIKSADRFTCVDHYILYENFPESYQQKGTVITNTVEVHKFYPIPENEHKNCIMYIGHLTEARGIWVFLDAVNQLKDKGYKFVIVGKGALESQIKKYINEHQLKAELRGAVEYEEMCKIYNEASVIVNPSPAEGIGNITLEAMSCGKCVIRTASKTKNYAIEDGSNGLLFEKGNAEDLAKKIDCAIQNPEKRIKIGNAARETILKEYTEEVEAKKYDKLFSDMLEN